MDDYLSAKYGAQAATTADSMGLAPTLIHGAVAAVADFGTTVWNSIPGTEDASTSDLLSRIDKDALQIYNEHPDAVQAASFIAGSFVPLGLAMKGLTAYRNGSKAISLFSKAGEVAQMKKVEDAFAMAGPNSELVSKATSALARRSVYNATLDSVAAEAAIVMTMNAHPYMEDYNKDFANNFAFWSGIGTIVGGGIGLVGSIAMTRNLTHGLESAVSKEVFEGYKPLEATVQSGEALQTMGRNVDNWKAKLTRSDSSLPEDLNYNLNPYTKKVLDFSITREEAFMLSMKGILDNASEELKKVYLDRFIRDNSFVGMDKASFYSPKSKGFEASTASLTDKVSFTTKIKTLINGVEGEKEVAQQVVYFPWANEGKGGFVSIKGAKYFGTLADSGNTIESLTTKSIKIETRFANHDTFTEIPNLATHDAEKLYAMSLLKVKDFGATEFNNARVASTDLPMLKALEARLKQLPLEEQNKTTIELITELPNKTSTRLNLAELSNHAKERTIVSVTDMAKLNNAVETISMRTGTPVETVVAILAKTDIPAKGFTKFSNEQDIIAALDQKNRAVAMSQSKKKVNNASIAASLNLTKGDNIANGLTDFYMAKSKSSLVQDIHNYFQLDDTKTINKVLSENIDKVTSSGLISTFFTSANRALEKMGTAGVLAVNMGKDVTTIVNKISLNFIDPISKQGGTILRDGAATLEHNISLNFNASLKGWRSYDETTGKIMQRTGEKAEDGSLILKAAQYNGKDFQIVNPEVRKMFELYSKVGREMYDLKNLKPTVYSNKSITDLGLWIPAFNPREKQIAYIFNRTDGTTTLLHARTPGELLDHVAAFEKNLPADSPLKVVMKGRDQEFYNKVAGRHDPMYMGIADVSMQHGGSSASAIVKTNSEPMAEVVGAYEHYLRAGVDDVVQLKLQPVMDQLKTISDISQLGYEKGTLGAVGKNSKKPVDVGMVVKNIILGKSNLSEHTAWAEGQQRGQVITDMAIHKITEIFSDLAPIAGKLFGNKSTRTSEEWTKINSQLETNGFVPFKAAQDYERYLNEGRISPEASTPRLVALTNGIAATSLLRFMELAQPLVNMVSLPILTSGAISRKLEGSFIDGVLDPKAKFHLVETMYDGIRLMNHPTEGPRIAKLAEAKHLFKAIVSEATDVIAQHRSLEGGVIARSEEVLHSKFLDMMAKPADYSETLVRKSTFFTGFAMAKKAYPRISDTGAMTFARNFMDEAIGNYTASQRPAMFQGTFGVAMGLFQTYMLTLGQQMYRQVENKDWAALGKMMLTQSSIFGASSLPGFHMVSEAIGTHMSDNHYDLETGTFRSIPDEAANILLYGLPSSFGPGITTRGDIQPRVPTVLTMDTIATVNLAKQSYLAGERLVTAAFTADKNTGRAMLEALSLQSLNRPIARISELASGNAITGAGEIVSSSEDIYTPQGIVARLMATRPLEEIKAREVINLKSVYGAADADNRKQTTRALKTMIRDGTLDSEKVQELQYEYMRTGTAQGWRAAIREAQHSVGRTGAENLKARLRPGEIYNVMVDDLE